MTRKGPVDKFTLAARWTLRVAKPEMNFDCAESIFQIPASEVTAKPTSGSTTAKTNATRVDVTVWRAVVEIVRVMGFLLEWVVKWLVLHVVEVRSFRLRFQCLTIHTMSTGRHPTVAATRKTPLLSRYCPANLRYTAPKTRFTRRGPREVALCGVAMDAASALSNRIEGPARWSLRLFGGFELGTLPGGERVALPGKREPVLLAHLALSPNCRQPHRKLTSLLWGDSADETLLDNLRACIWKLRKALGDTEHRVIASEGEDIVLDEAAFDVDVLAFRLLAAQSGRTELEVAANLCSGEFLDGLDIENEEFESWRRAEATRHRDQSIDVLNRLMTQLSECGETERAVETGVRILGLEPLHEAAVRRLMRLYGESGRRGAAVKLYRTLADALKTELDAQPEAETRTVFAQIARGGEERPQALVAPAAPAAADANPPPLASSPVLASNGPGQPRTTPAQQLALADTTPRQVAPQQAKGRKLNWILAGTLAAVVTIFLFYQFARWNGTTTGPPPGVAGTISIAVLPFANLSGDATQEFFSDGMTEEIITALAKIPDLRVVARTSAGQFKDEKRDVRAIGQALGATHLIEGSVRKEGRRVRITAQLIQSANGLNLWSGSYDRDLTDVFAIQEDIAQSIAAALRVPLGLKPGETLIARRIADPEIYEQYLRGVAQSRSSAPGAGATLETVVARAPAFAPGWSALGGAYRGASADAARAGDFKSASLLTDKEEAAARKTIQLDPSSVR